MPERCGLCPCGPQPWLEPLAPWPAALGWASERPLDLALLERLATARGCRAGSGRCLRFTAAGAGSMPGADYEQRIFDEGTVSTRLTGRGAVHDFANALAWLAYPRLKARLNALHVESLVAPVAAPLESGRRGTLRDRVTLFDESGVLVLTEAPDLAERVSGFRWRELFVACRGDWPGRIRVLPVGHALLEKLRSPYKSICAHAWLLALPPSFALDEIDQRAADGLDTGALGTLTPLPLMGIPGWCPANQDPTFYNDPYVFRSGRGR